MKRNNLIIAAFLSLLLMAGCTSEKKHETVCTKYETTIESILNRTSIREYTTQEISDADMELLLRAGMAAPSSRDRRPWHFIVISEKETLTALADQLKNASILRNADKAIVVCGDTLLSDNCWFLDCSAATQNILLAAQSMSLGAVWTAVYPYADREAVVNECFNLPENIRALAIIPLGYPSQEAPPKDKFDPQRIHYNNFTKQ